MFINSKNYKHTSNKLTRLKRTRLHQKELLHFATKRREYDPIARPSVWDPRLTGRAGVRLNNFKASSTLKNRVSLTLVKHDYQLYSNFKIYIYIIMSNTYIYCSDN